MRWSCALALGASTSLASQAQDIVYRCDERGHVSYTRMPCRVATGHAVDVADDRTPAQRLAALDRVQREWAWVQRTRHERLLAERSAESRAPSGFRTPARTASDHTADTKSPKPRIKPPRKSKTPAQSPKQAPASRG